MENEKTDRLGAAMEHAERITADLEADRAGKLKPQTIQISFNAAELDRLRGRADASCQKLQDYIRYILTTYA